MDRSSESCCVQYLAGSSSGSWQWAGRPWQREEIGLSECYVYYQRVNINLILIEKGRKDCKKD
jgi:hypothetical protein